MRFVPKTSKKARLLAEALSRSLNVTTTDTNPIVAALYGFSTWNTLCKAIQKEEPSLWDEETSSDIIESRQSISIERLVEQLDIDITTAKNLVDHVKPTSKEKGKAFPVDVENTKNHTDSINFADLFGGASGDEMEKMIEDFAKRTLGDELGDDFDFSNFSDRMRISKPIDPGMYYSICDNIGLTVIEDSFNEEYEYGHSSFCIYSKKEDVPVYITSLTMVPGDEGDEMAYEIMSIVEKNNDWDEDADRMILFWGQPSVKKINGKRYTYMGVLWEDGCWRDFLLNEEMKTIEDLFEMNPKNQNVNAPNENQEDKGAGLAIRITLFMNDLQDVREKVKFNSIGSPSGWDILLPHCD